jgi:hypothetical protein
VCPRDRPDRAVRYDLSIASSERIHHAEDLQMMIMANRGPALYWTEVPSCVPSGLRSALASANA